VWRVARGTRGTRVWAAAASLGGHAAVIALAGPLLLRDTRVPVPLRTAAVAYVEIGAFPRAAMPGAVRRPPAVTRRTDGDAAPARQTRAPSGATMLPPAPASEPASAPGGASFPAVGAGTPPGPPVEGTRWRPATDPRLIPLDGSPAPALRPAESEAYRLGLAARAAVWRDSVAREQRRRAGLTDWVVTDDRGRDWGLRSGGRLTIAGTTIPLPIPAPGSTSDGARRALERAELARQIADDERGQVLRERIRATREARDAARNAARPR
jgi:hypothetical protein